MAFAVGAQVDQYVILQVIRSEAPAYWYFAEHQLLRVQRLLKVVELPEASERDRDRLIAEGQSLARVESDHTIKVFGLFACGNHLVLEMEVSDMSISDLYDLHACSGRPDALQPQMAVSLIHQALLGLIAMRKTIGDFVHRDLRPGNLFVTEVPGRGWCVKVGGFALATTPGMDAPTVVFVDNEAPLYVAPEYYGDDATPRVEGDVFALGVILFRLLVGRPPIQQRKRGLLQVELAHHYVSGRPLPSLCSLAPSIPREIGEVVDRMLSIAPTDRPRSFEEAAEQLESLLNPSQHNAKVPNFSADILQEGIEPLVVRFDELPKVQPGEHQAITGTIENVNPFPLLCRVEWTGEAAPWLVDPPLALELPGGSRVPFRAGLRPPSRTQLRGPIRMELYDERSGDLLGEAQRHVEIVGVEGSVKVYPLDKKELALTFMAPSVVTARWVNRSGEVVDVRLTLSLPEGASYEVTPPALSLNPGDAGAFEVKITLPPGPQPTAGRYPVDLSLRSRFKDRVVVEESAWLEVVVPPRHDISMEPKIGVAVALGRLHVVVTNRGNVPDEITLVTVEGSASMRLPRGAIRVQPGASVEVPVFLSRPLFRLSRPTGQRFALEGKRGGVSVGTVTLSDIDPSPIIYGWRTAAVGFIFGLAILSVFTYFFGFAVLDFFTDRDGVYGLDANWQSKDQCPRETEKPRPDIPAEVARSELPCWDGCNRAADANDCDRDGVPDSKEVEGCYGKKDCDDDGVPDGKELAECMVDKDCDDDGLPDSTDKCLLCPLVECVLSIDCDSDNVEDSEEPPQFNQTRCNQSQDCDGDEVSDFNEYSSHKECIDKPDCDRDGIPDGQDPCPVCPNKKCAVEADCDADGVPDTRDTCPTEPEDRDNKCDDDGCPDPDDGDCDLDGVLDVDDWCSAKGNAGKPCDHGCSQPMDEDRDRVLNCDDLCPTRAGVPENQGCPIDPCTIDSDEDGVMNCRDTCPNERGVPPSGCPPTRCSVINIDHTIFRPNRQHDLVEGGYAHWRNINPGLAIEFQTDRNCMYDIQIAVISGLGYSSIDFAVDGQPGKPLPASRGRVGGVRHTLVENMHLIPGNHTITLTRPPPAEGPAGISAALANNVAIAYIYLNPR
jgi:serine/threonine protein kinase